MGYDISSASVDLLREKTPSLTRFVTIGGSDYSERVTKWPELSWSYDELRPKGPKIEFANNREISIDTIPYDVTSFTNVGGTYVYFGVDGNSDFNSSYKVSSGGAYMFLCREGPLNGVKRWTLPNSPYSFSGVNINSEQSYSDAGDTGLYGVDFTDDGSKFFVVSDTKNRIREFTPVTNFSISGWSQTGEYYVDSGESVTAPRYIACNSDASYVYIADTNSRHILQYELSTPGDITSAALLNTLTSWETDTGSGNPIRGFTFNPEHSALYIVGSGSLIHQYELSTPGDLSTAVPSSATINVSSSTGYVAGLGSAKDTGEYLYIGQPFHNRIYRYQNTNTQQTTETLQTDAMGFFRTDKTKMENEVAIGVYLAASEPLTLFKGKTSRIEYVNETLKITTVDKFKQLSDRKVGTPSDPVDFTDQKYLGSDLAWWLCTSYGGLSAIESTSNPDIDFAAFQAWAAVFSGDQIYFKARFDGQTPTEGLRKIARYSSSYIYVREGLVTFKRIGIAEVTVDSYGAAELLDLHLGFETANISNTVLASGNYDQTSGFQFTTTTIDSTSVNSFGSREELFRDEVLWYVDSGIAINHAQRHLIFNANPDDELTADTTARSWFRALGETISITDSFHNILNVDYLIDGISVDLENGTSQLHLDKILLGDPFILDTSTLDNTVEVLT